MLGNRVARVVGSTNANEHSSRSHWGNINRSLSTLGDVIYSLATKSPHIPFSPNENDLSETLRALNFASRVRGIELGPGKKQFDNTDLIGYKQLVEKNKQEMKIFTTPGLYFCCKVPFS
ncbi:hypothetical protein AgCh_000410 [Apium graveolens]